MAVSRKYAGLPDLDAAPEVYETPDLADDVSTLKTGTVHTISTSPSDDEAHPDLDRQPLDRSGAQRKFEPSLVDARDVNFSDAIGGNRRAYRTRSSRRRRRRQWEDGGEELGDLSDSEEETLGKKLARLKREAEEVRLELERREQEKGNADGELRNSVEQQQKQQHVDPEKDAPTADDIQELSGMLDELSTKTRAKSRDTAEDEFLSSLTSGARPRPRQTATQQDDPATTTTTKTMAASNLAAVAAVADRLTALEAALGVSSTRASPEPASILPTLETLSAQITTLSAALSPQPPTSTSLLDTVAGKLKTLIAESDRLTASRKQALASLADLHEKRIQNLVSATVHSTTRPRRGLSTTSNGHNPGAVGVATAGAGAATDFAGPGEESLQLQSRLFLDEQSSKINALHQLLPSIQDLQPLLPAVLERLRALSVVHAGAAQAKSMLDELESRQGEAKREMAEWREAVEAVEKGMGELETTMRENVSVIGDRLGGVEAKLAQQLGQPR